MTLFQKDSSAVLDYGFDWSAWLGNDTIDTSTWTVDTGIAVAADPAPSHTNTTTTVWLSGGTAGQTYTVTNRVITAGGRTDERSFQVLVMDR